MDKNKQQEFKEILDYYKDNKQTGSQEQIVELLRETQDLYSFIPLEAQEEIAKAMDIKPTALKTLIKLYPSLKVSNYKHKITICLGSRCGSKKASSILAALEKELKTKQGGISSDGKFALYSQNCLKNCKKSPNITIDEDLYTYVKPEEIHQILNKYK